MFKTDEELEVVRDAVHRMVYRALALDGTCKLVMFFFFEFPLTNTVL